MDLTASVGLRLSSAELPGAAERLAAELADRETPDLHLAAGLVGYLVADFPSATRHLETAFLAFKTTGQVRRAAVAATHLARVHQVGIGNAAVANGWVARAHRLLEREGECVELGWASLHVTGCSITDADLLERKAALALRLARQFDDTDLECKALADVGLALVGHGRVEEGMSSIDEAMAMASSGECDNAFITGQIRCCLVSACERTGDLPRLEEWLSVVTASEPHLFARDAPPSLLLSHCQTEYGSLLCQAARWDEAESALRRAADGDEGLHFHHRAESRAALAGLRVEQGRLAEAADLLTGFDQCWEAQLSLVRLHHARGDHDLAVAVARQALRAFVGDRLRSTPVLAVLVDAELARGNVAGAAEAVARLDEAAGEAPHPPVLATALRARAHLAATEGALPAAAADLEAALRHLPGDDWPLLAAELHLDLAQVLAGTDRVPAIAEARRALGVLGRVGAQRAREAQALLHRLGDAAAAAPAAGSAGRLTPREREILRLVAEGMSNPQIADRLVISRKTAEHHVGAILRKLQLTSRSEAAVYAATRAQPG